MRLKIKVIPGSNIFEVQNDIIKVSLRKPRENGKANRELIKLLAKHFKVTQDQVKIITGASSTNKLVQIDL